MVEVVVKCLSILQGPAAGTIIKEAVIGTVCIHKKAGKGLK
ncbi:MAG: hypothetical protein JWQ40_2252 [Segetibacter sp.]|jgi:hypothetical protein|nr:hypothetical protein [Segetibacter sp.]